MGQKCRQHLQPYKIVTYMEDKKPSNPPAFPTQSSWEYIAGNAYRLADAMLAEREKEKNGPVQ